MSGKSNLKIVQRGGRLSAIICAVTVLNGGVSTAHAQIMVGGFFGTSERIVNVTAGGSGSVFVLLADSDATKRPQGLAFDGTGNLYVSAPTGGVKKVTPAGVISDFAVTGLSSPRGLAFDGSGNLYIGNGDGNIRKVTPIGDNSLFVTLPNSITGIAFDAAGNLYAASATANTIYRVNSTGTSSEIFTTSNLTSPIDLAFDSVGNLFVSNHGDAGANTSIYKFTVGETVTSTLFTNTNLSLPWGLAFDLSDNLYVSNFGDGTIVKFTSSGVPTLFATVPDGTTDIAIFAIPEPSAYSTFAGLVVLMISVSYGWRRSGRVVKREKS